MARVQTFTQKQLESAKQSLAELPDLSRDKITQPKMLESLKEQIVTLASSKGYTATEIKSALAGLGVNVSTKSINDLIGTKKRTVTKKPRKAINASTPGNTPNSEHASMTEQK